MADKAVVTQATLDAIGQAIIAKGGASAPMTPAQMPGAIQAIPTTDPYYNEHWNPEPWMPNLRKILAEDTETRWTYKYAVLLVNKSGISELELNRAQYAAAIRVGNGEPSTNAKIPLRDPVIHNGDEYYYAVIYGNTNNVQMIRSNQFSPYGIVWVCSLRNDGLKLKFAYYSYFDAVASKNLRCVEADIIGGSDIQEHQFRSLVALEAIIGSLDLSETPSTSRMFESCTALRYLPEGSKVLGTNGDAKALFQNCHCLAGHEDFIDFSNVENLGSCFLGNNLSKPLDVYAPNATSISDFFRDSCSRKIFSRFYVPNVTSVSQWMFYGTFCRFLADEFVMTGLTSDIPDAFFNNLKNCLVELPKKFQVNKSFSFAQCVRLTEDHKDSFAKFENGTLVADCFASNLYDATGLNLTATMPSVLKDFYTSTEQAAIEAAFNAKGWTLAW